MPRGGRRAGTPGAAYANRSDLTGPTLPAQAAPNQPYGAAGAQIAAQQAVPIARAGVQAPTTPPPAAAGLAPVLPGSLPALDRPTERPNEPVTAGAPLGPGPGPEAVQPIAPGGGPPDTVAALVSGLNTSGSSDLQYLAAFVNGGRR